MLGDLAGILLRRRIAVGVDSRGQVVLARPDTVQVDYHDDVDHRNAVLELVNEIDADNDDFVDHDEAEETGVLTVRVPGTVDEGGAEARWALGAARSAVERLHSRGVRADFNYVVFGAQSVVPQILGGAVAASSVPATSATAMISENRAALTTTAHPALAPRHLRQPLDLDGFRRPRVLVIDTGLRTRSSDDGSEPEHAFLRTTDPSRIRVHLHDDWRSNPAVDAVDDEDEPDDDHSGLLDFEAGHGTFITGIVRQVCPDAVVCPAGVLSSFGEGSLGRVRTTIRRMNRSCGPFDIVVMSFGTFCIDDDPGLLRSWMPRLLGDAIGVAAAGNMQSARPYFPAALPGVAGVGGLDRGGRAWFTNFGGWVDACAPAVDVVSTFFNDVTEELDGRPKRRFREWARWSGTSFAAPKVAGAIAQEMYLSQVSAKEAWRRLSSPDRLRMPDLGVAFNV